MMNTPNPYFINNVPGNRALSIIVNSSDEIAYAGFYLGILPSLNHFGFPYRIIDLSDTSNTCLTDCAAVIFGHDNVGADLPSALADQIGEAAKSGCGLVSFDGALYKSPSVVRELFGLDALQYGEFKDLVGVPGHYISQMQITGRVNEFHLPVFGCWCSQLDSDFSSVATDSDGRVLTVAGDKDGCRRAAFLLSPNVWLRQHFGHAMGMDDLLWRSIVWTARKPFPVLMMPPFAVCRIDDAIGSYDNFGYIGTLNKHKWRSNIGVFVDDIDEKGAIQMRRYAESGAAEFSAHSFHEIGEPYPDQIYIRHDGVEYTFAELKAIFDRLDTFFDRVGIKPSRTSNIHYDEIGINALPFLAARGLFFTMDFIPFGVAWDANSYSWSPYPYGHQSMNYAPMDPDPRFWNVMGHCLSSYKTPDAWMSPGEFMGGRTAFDREGPTDIQGAVDTGVLSVKTGVSSGFFGTLMCHEQRIQSVTSEEWEKIIAGVSHGLSDWQLIYKGYDEIAQYCKDKARTHISTALFDHLSGNLITRITGICDSYLSCYIFTDSEDGCEYELRHIPSFAGDAVV